MKLTEKQLEQICRACESVEYGSVTIKMNATAKFVDIVIENQIRIQNSEPTVTEVRPKDKKYC